MADLITCSRCALPIGEGQSIVHYGAENPCHQEAACIDALKAENARLLNLGAETSHPSDQQHRYDCVECAGEDEDERDPLTSLRQAIGNLRSLPQLLRELPDTDRICMDHAGHDVDAAIGAMEDAIAALERPR